MVHFQLQRWALPAILAWVSPAAPLQTAQAPQRVQEYQAKATILRAVGNYTHWPETKVKNPSNPFVIGILGDSPFGRHLEDQIQGQQVRGRSIRLLYMRSLKEDDIEICDLLFICESESDRLTEVLEVCKDRPILTLGDTPGYSHRGVMLDFTFEAQLLGLEANLKSIRTAGLEVSSSFLAISKAKIVNQP